MFIRAYDKDHRKEIYLNLNYLRKIEVDYGHMNNMDGKNVHIQCSLDEGYNDPLAIKCYTVYIDNEKLTILADETNNPIIETLENICINSIQSNVEDLGSEEEELDNKED